jgi:hypothetical protein
MTNYRLKMANKLFMEPETKSLGSIRKTSSRNREFHSQVPWKFIIWILFGICILSFGFPASAGVGDTGANFLLLGGGARALGMGEAYVALADDSSSILESCRTG